MDTALLAFDVDGLHQGRLLRPFDALLWMEALEATLARQVLDNGSGPSCFITNTSKDVSDPAPHSMFFLPISHDARRARLDQVLIHAPNGFDPGACSALRKLRQIDSPLGAATVVLVDLGLKADFTDKVDHFCKSKVWQSTTPVVSFVEATDGAHQTFEQQIRNELLIHGLPPCTGIDVFIDRGRFLRFNKFQEVLKQTGGSTFPADSGTFAAVDPNRPSETNTPPVFGLRLQFNEFVQGPLALGQWARYGMGQFLPG